jgi:hypothetical protein
MTAEELFSLECLVYFFVRVACLYRHIKRPVQASLSLKLLNANIRRTALSELRTLDVRVQLMDACAEAKCDGQDADWSRCYARFPIKTRSSASENMVHRLDPCHAVAPFQVMSWTRPFGCYLLFNPEIGNATSHPHVSRIGSISFVGVSSHHMSGGSGPRTTRRKALMVSAVTKKGKLKEICSGVLTRTRDRQMCDNSTFMALR